MEVASVRVGVWTRSKCVISHATKLTSKAFFFHQNMPALAACLRFPVDRWLDIGEGDKRISLDLEPDKKPGQLKGKNACAHSR